MKKFSEKYINNYKDLSVMKVGLEFEFYSTEISYFKMLEILNNSFHPVKVHGFKTYHSDYNPIGDNFKLERDLSGGSDMIELITSPMDFFKAKFYLIKILKFIQEYGYTNNKCSLHINLSIDGEKTTKQLRNLNILKQILRTDEEDIYKTFPSRKNNIYAKSIKKLIPFENYDFSNVSIDYIQNNIKTNNSKYYGINFSNMYNSDGSERIEYRYIGGKGYEFLSGDIIEFMSVFSMDIINNLTTEFSEEDSNNLAEFLDNKISNFKNFNTYDKFLVEFPDINIQVNQNPEYNTVNSYYPSMYKQLYEFIESTEELGECTINFFIEENRFEVINADFVCISMLESYDFIDCEITNGMFNSCNIINTNVNNSEISMSNIHGSNIIGSKVINCTVEHSKLDDCFFMNGYLNSEMIGGIFRSGKLGPYADMSPTTKIIGATQNFFGTEGDDSKGKTKGKGKGLFK
jgi:hypothetical protein